MQTELVIIAILLLLSLTARHRKNVKAANEEWRNSIEPLSQDSLDAFDDFEKNSMRLYLSDGTKLTTYKGKLVAKIKVTNC